MIEIYQKQLTQTTVLLNPRFRKHTGLLAIMTLMMATLSACASGSADRSSGLGNGSPADRILACKSTDRLIASQDQCLQDDAACYAISDGQWCTGPRGNVCPAGSQPLAAGSPCPAGARCFQISESLECRI